MLKNTFRPKYLHRTIFFFQCVTTFVICSSWFLAAAVMVVVSGGLLWWLAPIRRHAVVVWCHRGEACSLYIWAWRGVDLLSSGLSGKQRTRCHWAPAWIWNSDIRDVDSHSRRILSKLRLNTLSIFWLALSVSKTAGESCCAQWCLLWLLMAAFVQMIDGKSLSANPVMIQLSLIMLPNHEGFFFSDLTFLLLSVLCCLRLKCYRFHSRTYRR